MGHKSKILVLPASLGRSFWRFMRKTALLSVNQNPGVRTIRSPLRQHQNTCVNMKNIAIVILLLSTGMARADIGPQTRTVETDLQPGEFRCVVSDGHLVAETLLRKGPGFSIWEDKSQAASSLCAKNDKIEPVLHDEK